jgi:hypothetical protein
MTFKQPFLDKIEDTLDKAVSITWEGCHKIYICLDMESHDHQVECGYEMVSVKDKAEALNELWEWWNSSCGLRFISAIEGESTFHDVIPQFDYDEHEPVDAT